MKDVFAVVGFLAVIVVIYVLIRVSRKKGNISAKGEYDERQELIRGRGYKLGCILYMIEFGFLIFADGLRLDLPLTSGALYVILWLLPIGVFSVYCIVNDAYIGVRNDLNRFMMIAAVIVVIDIISTAAQIAGGKLIADGKLTSACITPACGLLFLAVLISLSVRNRQLKAAERSGDEES